MQEQKRRVSSRAHTEHTTIRKQDSGPDFDRGGLDKIDRKLAGGDLLIFRSHKFLRPGPVTTLHGQHRLVTKQGPPDLIYKDLASRTLKLLLNRNDLSIPVSRPLRLFLCLRLSYYLCMRLTLSSQPRYQ